MTERNRPDRDDTDERDVLHEEDEPREADTAENESDAPHTTRGKVTAPKFGSAGSGGAELEPLP